MEYGYEIYKRLDWEVVEPIHIDHGSGWNYGIFLMHYAKLNMRGYLVAKKTYDKDAEWGFVSMYSELDEAIECFNTEITGWFTPWSPE